MTNPDWPKTIAPRTSALTRIAAISARCGVGLVLLYAAWSKLHRWPPFAQELAALPWSAKVPALAYLVVASEFTIGAYLVLGRHQRTAAAAAIIMLCGFTLYLALRPVQAAPCHCMGASVPSFLTTGPGLYLRNALLIAAASFSIKN